MKNLTDFTKFVKMNEKANSDFDIDWDEVFKPYTEDELNSIRKEEKEKITVEKDHHAKKISASGNNWMDATLKRINTVKSELKSFTEKCKNKNLDKDDFNLVETALNNLDEMGFEAKEYSKHLRKYWSKISKKY